MIETTLWPAAMLGAALAPEFEAEAENSTVFVRVLTPALDYFAGQPIKIVRQLNGKRLMAGASMRPSRRRPPPISTTHANKLNATRPSAHIVQFRFTPFQSLQA